MMTVETDSLLRINFMIDIAVDNQDHEFERLYGPFSELLEQRIQAKQAMIKHSFKSIYKSM